MKKYLLPLLLITICFASPAWGKVVTSGKTQIKFPDPAGFVECAPPLYEAFLAETKRFAGDKLNILAAYVSAEDDKLIQENPATRMTHYMIMAQPKGWADQKVAAQQFANLRKGVQDKAKAQLKMQADKKGKDFKMKDLLGKEGIFIGATDSSSLHVTEMSVVNRGTDTEHNYQAQATVIMLQGSSPIMTLIYKDIKDDEDLEKFKEFTKAYAKEQVGAKATATPATKPATKPAGKPGQSKPAQAKPGQAKPGQNKPGQSNQGKPIDLTNSPLYNF